MRWKLAILALLLFGSFYGFWWGFDSVRVSHYSSELATFTMDDIEKNGIGDKRYIKITDAFWDGSYVYQAKVKKRDREVKPDTEIEFIEYPLLSTNDAAAMSEGKPVTAKVIVLRNLDNVKFKDLESWTEQNVKYGRTTDVEGVTRVGLDSLESESKRILQSLDMKINDDVIFVEAGRKPNSTVYGLGVLLASAIGTLAAVGLSVYWILSFRRR